MLRAFHDVKSFHGIGAGPIAKVPAFPSEEQLFLRDWLINEERDEYNRALAARDLVKVADNIVDQIYILIGTAVVFGIPVDRIWDRVQRANMDKAFPDTGRLKLREDGKVLKPEGWQSPDDDIRQILIDHGAKLD